MPGDVPPDTPRNVAASDEEQQTERSPARPPQFGLHTLAPIVLLGFGGAVALLASQELGLGSLTAPGPGLWPFIVAVVVVASALFLVVRDNAADYERWQSRSLRIVGVLTCLALFVSVFPLLGLIVPGIALLGVWLRVFAHESWRLTLTIAFTLPVALFALFDLVLGVPFPTDVVADPLLEVL